MKNKSKEPRIVVISGSTSGIGKELCRLYREKGDTVIGIARSASEEQGDIAADVTDYEKTAEAVKAIGEKYGRIDVVIANAGGGLSGATEYLPIEEIQKQISLNFTGALNLVQAALGFMKEGGKVVFISSACALFALPYRAMYCASKAAVNMAAFGLYMELKNHGIRVSTVCPGDIKTNFTANRVKYADGGERYGDAPLRSAQKIDSRENKRMNVKSATQKIYKYCEKCKKPMYIVGFKYKLLNFLRHILPQKLFLDITAKLF
ncbi:MAG: SDR family NAD(P)-dependent oxidoreductase [Clostridiales bacterium]|nr:SDR family NAD(P)-dependent oxidoreductase [Clostridiales bacterium]